MNACIRAVVRSGLHYDMDVWGIYRGYDGLIKGDIVQLDSRSVSGIIQKGGTFLGSARSDEFRTPEGRKRAYEQIQALGIEGIVAIGGDGTFTGGKIFMEEYPDVAFVGVPGTIDNDLYGTDFTIGYDTAINTAMEAIDKIRDTADAHNRLFFVEVMGRDAGFIAMRTGIATGADSILVPEYRTDTEDLIEFLKRRFNNKKTSGIIVVAEGDDEGGAFKIAEAVKGKIPYQDIRVTILGHIQRGGSPTCMDRVLASRLGVGAVEALRNGQKGVMIGQRHQAIVHVPFEKAIKHNQRLSPYLEELGRVLAV